MNAQSSGRLGTKVLMWWWKDAVVVFAEDRVVLGSNEASVAELVFTASFRMGLMLFLSHNRLYIMTVSTSCSTAVKALIVFCKEAAFLVSKLQTCCHIDNAFLAGKRCRSHKDSNTRRIESLVGNPRLRLIVSFCCIRTAA